VVDVNTGKSPDSGGQPRERTVPGTTSKRRGDRAPDALRDIGAASSCRSSTGAGEHTASWLLRPTGGRAWAGTDKHQVARVDLASWALVQMTARGSARACSRRTPTTASNLQRFGNQGAHRPTSQRGGKADPSPPSASNGSSAPRGRCREGRDRRARGRFADGPAGVGAVGHSAEGRDRTGRGWPPRMTRDATPGGRSRRWSWCTHARDPTPRRRHETPRGGPVSGASRRQEVRFESPRLGARSPGSRRRVLRRDSPRFSTSNRYETHSRSQQRVSTRCTRS